MTVGNSFANGAHYSTPCSAGQLVKSVVLLSVTSPFVTMRLLLVHFSTKLFDASKVIKWRRYGCAVRNEAAFGAVVMS